MSLNPFKDEELKIRKTGTTTLGIICKDGVVVAAEKKSTMGYLVASKETEKIIPIADHIVLTTAGASGDAQTLARYMKAEIKLYEIQNQKKIPVKAAATLLANILQSNKYYPYYVQLIVAGYDDDEGPAVYSLDAIGGMEREKKFFSTGSGSPIALGVLEAEYKEGISVNEAKELAYKAIKSAVERDIASGGKGVDIAVITEKGIQIERREL